jgi:uncharacterized protein
MIQLLRSEDHRRMPWRNGAGVTHEVASSPAEAGLDAFDWRISMADVPGGGPFSRFAGIDRTLILIEGEWMALTVDGRRHRFGLHEPFSFDGGSETVCEVPGPSRDLNVMTRRGRAAATVTVSTAQSPGRQISADAGQTAFVCLTAGVRLAANDGTEVALGPLDAALTTDGVTLTGEGTVIVIRFA